MAKIAPEEIQKIITLQEVMDCFFEGGLAGYAGGGGYKPSQDIMGGKVFTSRADKLIYSDLYVSNGPQSGGMTIISLDYLLILPTHSGFRESESVSVPLWMMHYDGKELSDDKRVTELVKMALSDAYTKRIFCGGRGLPHYPDDAIYEIDGMRYWNEVNYKHNSFAKFSGKETVVKNHGKTVFYHNYSGKLLVSIE